ncbi:unnamed protein product [Acanthoscelides obtectus]|uniref:Uncharacterized protein n=2 Tax=Acanthoscelides obtectus TaxID=200917 RepID=A0A9P0KEC8_ACAOB|nr:unnamed protein product [Acanthoscelides obtectus]CAK1644781.1 hypothetical protein AOBTE_LOCUS13935 [Acanthoscelides obtectus]
MYVDRNNLLGRCFLTREHNVIRWTELILCMVCLLLSILMFHKRVFITTKIVHATVNAAFVFITATDVISWCVKTPITIKTWMIISTAGFLMYCLNAGLLLFTKRVTSSGLITFNIVACIIAAIAFLIDCIWICWEYIHADFSTVQTVDRRVIPGKVGGVCTNIECLKADNLIERVVDRAVSACCLMELNEIECPVVRKRRCNAVHPIIRPMSYGGTFPVDKYLAPLSSGASYRSVSRTSDFTGTSPCPCSRSRSIRLVSSSRSTDTTRRTTDRFYSQEYRAASLVPEEQHMLESDTVPERDYVDEHVHRPAQETSYRSSEAGYSDVHQKTQTCHCVTSSAQGRGIESIAEEDPSQ